MSRMRMTWKACHLQHVIRNLVTLFVSCKARVTADDPRSSLRVTVLKEQIMQLSALLLVTLSFRMCCTSRAHLTGSLS